MLSIFVVTLLGCQGSSGGGGSHNNQAQNLAQIDLEVAAALYAGQRTPAGFFTDAPADEGNYYTVYHVKNSHQPSYVDGFVYPLCSDDFAEASLLAENAISSQPIYRDLSDTRDTALFFEFTRVSPLLPSFIHLVRVYKCSYWLAAQVEHGANKITRTPLTKTAISNVLEYQWWFSSANNTGYAVLETTIEEQSNAFIFTLEEASFVDQDSECDLIEVVAKRSYVDKISGEVSSEINWAKDISVRNDQGQISICS